MARTAWALFDLEYVGRPAAFLIAADLHCHYNYIYSYYTSWQSYRMYYIRYVCNPHPHTHTCTVIYAVRFNVYHNIVHICISCINLIIFDPDLCDPWHFFCQRIWSGLVKDWSTAIFQQDGALLRRCTSEDSHDSRVLTGAIRSHLRVFGSRPCHVRFFRCCSIRFNEFGSLAV